MGSIASFDLPQDFFPWESCFLDRLSRREFLFFARKGLLSLFTLPFITHGRIRQLESGALGIPESGRILDDSVAVFDRPSLSGKLVNMYWRDLVLPINAATIGDDYPEHNRVWYQINNHEGYVHSGKIQPVSIRYNESAAALNEKGALAEVTVPFTDAFKDPDRPDWFAYRLYYNTLYWVKKIVKDKKGSDWYQIPDDKYKTAYFARAEHLRIIPADELSPISPHIPADEKRLEVRLKQQVLIAYEKKRPVFMSRVASGGRFIDGDYSTPVGEFMTNRKRPSRHMASEDLAAPSSYDLPGVPWVSYLTNSGISFHGTYWHNDFGKPRSHGCINLSVQAAKWVYRWSQPSVPLYQETWNDEQGTRVDVVE